MSPPDGAVRLMRTNEAEERRKAAARAANTGELNARWAGDNVGYAGLHAYLNRHYPKDGICQGCGSGDRRTDYALIHGRDYSRERADYLELCTTCHRWYDHGGELAKRAKLTWPQVEEIRRRYTPGRRAGAGEQPNSQRALAREFQVAKSTIRAIVAGPGWQRSVIPQ